MAFNRISEQTILEKVFNPTYNILNVGAYGFDGKGLSILNSSNLQIYSVSSGGYNYFCFAAPGTALADANWQIFRIDGDGSLIYADANANYDNVATDPTLLSYSYS